MEPHLERRSKRDEWCAQRQIGEHTVVFFPGEELRCPGTRIRYHGDHGVVCGIGLLDRNGRPKPGTQVVVRIRPRGFTVSRGLGLDLTCRSCGSDLEILPIAETTG